MSTRRRCVRLTAGVAAAAALPGATATPAYAWPIPLTSEDNNYLSAVRGSWHVDDDTLLMAGRGESRARQLLHAGPGLAVHTGVRSA